MQTIHSLENAVTCPGCGKPVEEAAGIRTPREGDVTVCTFCGQIGRFGPRLAIWPMDEADEVLLSIDQPEVLTVARAMSAKAKLRRAAEQAAEAIPGLRRTP